MDEGSQRKVRGRNKTKASMPVSPTLLEMPTSYGSFLETLKERISHERLKAVLSANAAMVILYWDIGQSVLTRQRDEGWGARVIDRLSYDLKATFPDMTGLSPRNIKYMRKFADAWPDRAIVQDTLAQITWYHNLALLEKSDSPEHRLWYVRKTVEHGWTRNVLVA